VVEKMKKNFTIWLTGLPCSGKTTIAKKLKEELNKKGFSTVHLDGDDIREKLNADLGFSEEDRSENLRRVAHVARLFNENGNLVIASFVSPTNKMRNRIKEIIGNIKLVYVKCDLETCKKRDTKNMYRKARMGEIKNFTGISAPFEDPENVDIVIDSQNNNVETCAQEILNKL
jgi:adenylyl-sulfate kinase